MEKLNGNDGNDGNNITNIAEKIEIYHWKYY